MDGQDGSLIIKFCPVGDALIFKYLQDPGEHIDLALAQPVLARLIYEKLENATRGWFDPDRGVPDQRACAVAQSTGFWGPFM